MIENALFKRLDSFPKIPCKDYVKLRELGDPLVELQSAKEDGYLTGLAFLDTARGINPIVEKLPHALQEKWISCDSKFKADNNGHFPPFSFFAAFICQEARTRNDPNFAFASNSNAPMKERPYSKQNESPAKKCPIHNKPHPLKKRRAFREMPWEKRKVFL